MKKLLRASLVLLVVSVSNLYASYGPMPREFQEGYQLLKAIELNQLVVVGRVSGIEYVTRSNISNIHTTDITVSVDETLKGTPNFGSDRVKFMIKGGEGIDTLTGKPIRLHVSYQPDFKLGERVLLLLTNSASRDPDAAYYPHGRYRLARGEFGKRLVADGKVYLRYLDSYFGNTLKSVELPLDMAVDLAKAFKRDKEAAILLENSIKTLAKSASDDVVKLNSTTIKNIKRGAKQILDRPNEGK